MLNLKIKINNLLKKNHFRFFTNQSKIKRKIYTIIIRRVYHVILTVKNKFSPRRIIILSSAHKVGSTWLFKIIQSCGFLQVTIPNELKENGTLLLNDKTQKFLTSLKSGKFVFKSHSFPYKFLDEDIMLVTMVRDPRDVIISSIFYLANLSEELGGWGKEFANKSEVERIKEIIKKGDFLLNRLEAWFNNQDSYLIKYEKLKTNVFHVIKEFFQQQNFKISDSKIKKAIRKNSFKKLSGRSVGVEDKNNFYRKGTTGDWKNYFDSDCVKLFKKEKEGRWNNLLLKIGYEKNENW